MLAATFLFAALTVAQAAPLDGAPLDNGPCLDSPRSVPRVLQSPVDRMMQIVRIDKVESTSSMMPGEVIGFLYSLGDGSTWLGQRTDRYMSPAAAEAVNNVLSNTHLPGHNISAFPPQSRYGVPTKYPQFYQVKITPEAMSTLRVTLVPCVLWPPNRALPDPTM